jgi:hypothetical protein
MSSSRLILTSTLLTPTILERGREKIRPSRTIDHCLTATKAGSSKGQEFHWVKEMRSMAKLMRRREALRLLELPLVSKDFYP